MQNTAKKILIINGSIRGRNGNSGALAAFAADMLSSFGSVDAEVLTLCDPMPSVEEVYRLLQESDGFLVISGVYWNSWGSPFQRFVEVATAFEQTPAFFGKPVACAVSMDSVGGIEVAGRIHAVCSGLGCWSPPCATVVLSRVGAAAIAASEGTDPDLNEDVWRQEDMKIMLQNLATAVSLQRKDWVSWPHISLKMPAGPWPTTGMLDMESPRFL